MATGEQTIPHGIIPGEALITNEMNAVHIVPMDGLVDDEKNGQLETAGIFEEQDSSVTAADIAAPVITETLVNPDAAPKPKGHKHGLGKKIFALATAATSVLTLGGNLKTAHADIPQAISALGKRCIQTGKPNMLVEANATAVNMVGDGFLTVMNSTDNMNTHSNVNYARGDIVSGATFTMTNGDGLLCVASMAQSDAILDVNYAISPDAISQFNKAPRVADSREAGSVTGGRKLQAGEMTYVDVGQEYNGQWVIVNLTATEADAPGFLTLFSNGQSPAGHSTTNYERGQNVANIGIVQVFDGKVGVYAYSTTHFAADVQGVFKADVIKQASAEGPVRILDTRLPGSMTGGNKIPAGGVLNMYVGVEHAGELAILNVTSTEGDAAGFITAVESGANPWASSTTNTGRAGENRGSATLVRVGANGYISVAGLQSQHVVVDLNGFMPGNYINQISANGPVRGLDTRNANQNVIPEAPHEVLPTPSCDEAMWLEQYSNGTYKYAMYNSATGAITRYNAAVTPGYEPRGMEIDPTTCGPNGWFVYSANGSLIRQNLADGAQSSVNMPPIYDGSKKFDKPEPTTTGVWFRRDSGGGNVVTRPDGQAFSLFSSDFSMSDSSLDFVEYKTSDQSNPGKNTVRVIRYFDSSRQTQEQYSYVFAANSAEQILKVEASSDGMQNYALRSVSAGKPVLNRIVKSGTAGVADLQPINFAGSDSVTIVDFRALSNGIVVASVESKNPNGTLNNRMIAIDTNTGGTTDISTQPSVPAPVVINT